MGHSLNHGLFKYSLFAASVDIICHFANPRRFKCRHLGFKFGIHPMADSSQFSPLTTLLEQLGPNSWVSSVFIPVFIANIGKHFFLKYDYQNSKSI